MVERAMIPALLPTSVESMLLTGRLAASSIAMYKRDFASYLCFVREHGWDPLEAATLAFWRNQLISTTAMSPRTINRMITAVKRVLKEAAKQEVLTQEEYLRFNAVEGVSVLALKSRLRMHNRTRIEPADMRRLCDSPDSSTLVGLRDRALLLTLASSGGRAAELATLTQAQVLQRKENYALSICGKTDIEPRDALLSKEAYAAIHHWVAARGVESACVFTGFSRVGRVNTANVTPMGARAIWEVVRKYARRCDLSHLKPHDFRRFLGTQLAVKDIRVAQKALGHKRLETTADNYVLDDLPLGSSDNLF